MKPQEPISATILVIFFACLSAAQTLQSDGVVSQLELPGGEGAWVVQIFTAGGFLGSGGGDFGVTSTGRIVCSIPEMRCPKVVEPSELRSLVEMIPVASLPSTLMQPSVSFCSDCLRRTIVIRWRSNGMEHTRTASWDDLTRSNVPRAVIQLYDAVAALRK